MEHLLSIVIPTYNRSKTLKRALDAIASQYDERVEVLVCDDQSPDDTGDIVVEAQKKLPLRYVRNETNLGFDRNFIHCYQEAKGKFVLIMGDDDFLIQGGIAHILSYLEENPDVEWVYMNVAPFEGDISYLETNLKAKRPETDRAHISKQEFMRYVEEDISALSSIVRRESIERIADPAKYIGTFFLQTCFWLDATRADDSVLGIIGKACIAYNYTGEDLNVIKNPSKYFQAFGKGFRHVFYVVGPECGYDEEQMKGIFNTVRWWRGVILRMNARKIQGWRKAFWQEGFPVIRDIPSACIRMVPLTWLPSFAAKFLVDDVRPIYKKIKKIFRE